MIDRKDYILRMVNVSMRHINVANHCFAVSDIIEMKKKIVVSFKVIEEPFLYAVELILGDRCTTNMQTIYKAVVTLMITEMEKSCEIEQTRLKALK